MSDQPANRRAYAVQSYLRIGARPIPGATLMHRAMRGHDYVGTVAHVNLEPGDLVPSRGDMTRLVARLEVQQLIIGVLHWILENENWLQHAALRLSFDESGSEVGGHQLGWREKVGRARYEAARRAIPELCELLRQRRHFSKPRYVRVGIVEAMNDVDWSPDRVVDALGVFAAPISPEEGQEWIERHKQAYQHRILQDKTLLVAPSVARRRL